MAANPRRTPAFWLHRDHLAHTVDLAKTAGLEIGAMDMPFVAPGEGNCQFADFRTTDELRELADGIEGHHPEFVVPVAYDLRRGYEAITTTYDWIAASHVIEHIPDLIWWLGELRSKLKAGGAVFLVVPDKRFTFDHHRRETNVSDAVSSHQQRLRLPSYRQVFDHYYYTTKQMVPRDIWNGSPVPPPLKDYTLAARRALDAVLHFEDAHCSVFTPTSFAELMHDLAASGLIGLRLESLRSTQLDQLDFSAVMRKV